VVSNTHIHIPPDDLLVPLRRLATSDEPDRPPERNIAPSTMTTSRSANRPDLPSSPLVLRARAAPRPTVYAREPPPEKPRPMGGRSVAISGCVTSSGKTYSSLSLSSSFHLFDESVNIWRAFDD
jgi:hypothetical protein